MFLHLSLARQKSRQCGGRMEWSEQRWLVLVKAFLLASSAWGWAAGLEKGRAGLQHSEISLGQFGSEFFLIIWSQLLLSVSERSCRNISFSAVEVRIYCAMYNCRKSNSVIFPCSKTDFCGCFQRSDKGSGLWLSTSHQPTSLLIDFWYLQMLWYCRWRSWTISYSFVCPNLDTCTVY